jgi:predicted TPR repeat methyltransferase
MADAFGGQDPLAVATRLQSSGRTGAAFAVILDALRPDPCVRRLQEAALKLIAIAQDAHVAVFVRHWLETCRFGNLENALIILADCMAENDDVQANYTIFGHLSIMALRLEKHDLALTLFSHCLSDQLPPPLSEDYVAVQYDDKAVCYDDDYLHKVSVVSFLAFLAKHATPPEPLDILDVPCGTGLIGPVLKPWARRLTGCDLSPGMAAHARARDCYDEVIVGDMLTSLPVAAADLAISHGSLYYFRELEPVAAALAAALRPGGLFAFTDYPAPEGVMVTKSGIQRYCRSRPVVLNALEAHGFSEVASEMHLTFGLPCIYWIFRKTGA